MNKIYPILTALFQTITISTALASSPGENEYIHAEKLRSEVELQIKRLAMNYPGPTASETIRANAKIKTYHTLLAKSVRKGFPPALYRTAQILGNEPSTMYKNKTEICNLLNQAAEGDLLSAKHANFFFCSSNTILFSLGTEEASKLMKPLTRSLELEDPYKKFYPLPTIKQPLCHTGSPQNPLDASNPFAFIVSTAKPALSYAEYLADIHLLLYISQHELAKPSAEHHKEEAKKLNCAGVTFFSAPETGQFEKNSE
nr:hypothetical protein [Pseudomonas alcaliphila]